MIRPYLPRWMRRLFTAVMLALFSLLIGAGLGLIAHLLAIAAAGWR